MKLVQNKKTYLLGIEPKTSVRQRITFTTDLKTIYLKPTYLFTIDDLFKSQFDSLVFYL